MTILDILNEVLNQQSVVKSRYLPNKIKITETGDYGQTVRILDTNIFRKPKNIPKPKKIVKNTSIDNDNYDKLIDEFNLKEE